jgi:two-component system KDP operon response regulator KdpE
MYGTEREYLRVIVNQLRKKIEADPSHPVYILTESHIGYRFRPEDLEDIHRTATTRFAI